MEELNYKFNKYQTPITSEFKKKLPKEVYDNILEYITEVQFIKNLISKDRGYIKDRPVMTYTNDDGEEVPYEDGRKLIDITNPHILEDLDFFRERAIFFKKHGKYTNITPNANPKSDYAKFWKEELRRWKYGLVRPDGEWIPGELYYYWNYCPIPIVETDNNSRSSKRGVRKRSFPNPWLGDYLFFHYVDQGRELGKHGKLIKCRGIGFSLKAGGWSPRNMYIYPGSQNSNYHLASEKSFLSGDKGIWGKILDSLDWIAEHTPLPRMRLVDKKQAMEVQLGYEDEYGVRKGLLSSVYAISLKDNPDKARGVRGAFMHYEEDGLFPNLEKAWNVNRKAFEDGGVASGYMLSGGTGGVEGASFIGSEKLFYKPEAYNIYGVPNVYDKNINGETKCGFFWGGYLSRNKCYNLENGEPDVIKALTEICLARYKIKYNSSDSSSITQAIAEDACTPQEAIMRTEGTVFPVSDLREYLESISVKKDSFLSNHYVGELVYDPNGQLIWRPTDKHPIRSYDVALGDKTGCLEIFEMPRKNAQGEVIRDRYILGVDPIDSDSGESMFSVLVMDTFTDRIVAEYTGRPRLASDAYEIALRTAKFYNGQINYENNLKGMFSYFDQKNALQYLADVPQILKDMEFVRDTNLYGNKSKGSRANAQVNAWGRKLQADWMLQPAHSNSLEEDEENKKLNLHTIRSFGYLEEAIKWNPDGNFDRISAGIMLFILREDRYKRTQSAKENQNRDLNNLSNDPFFSKNFKTNKTKESIWE